jgi:hypothetical protein
VYRNGRVIRDAGTLAVFFGLLAASATVARPAQADLRDVASRVHDEWQRAGATVTRSPTRFVYEDETASFAIPVAPEGMCTTVAMVGARGLSFHVKIGGADDDPLAPDEGARAASIAGVVQIGRCDGTPMRRLVVTSDAGRGAIEIVVAHSRSPVPPLRTVLPERTGGVTPPAAEPGALPPLLPPQHRADVAEGRARRDGAVIASRESWTAGVDGNGDGHVALDAGCHRLEIFAADPRAGGRGRRFRLDIDAELRDDEDGAMLGRDRTDAPDAHVEACIGKETEGSLVYSGAPPNETVLVTHASWAIPRNLPWAWGPEARGKMAGAMLARHLASPPDAAVVLAQGAAGTTMVPVELEPGGCYVAVAAVTQGHARGVGVRAIVGARQSTDERGINDEAGAVAFCAREQSRARVEVDARGTALAWGLAVFRIDSGLWGASR